MEGERSEDARSPPRLDRRQSLRGKEPSAAHAERPLLTACHPRLLHDGRPTAATIGFREHLCDRRIDRRERD